MPRVVIIFLCLGLPASGAAGEVSIDADEQAAIDSYLPSGWQKPLGEAPRLIITLPEKSEDAALSADGTRVYSWHARDTVLVNRVLAHWSFEIVVGVLSLLMLVLTWKWLRRPARVIGEPYCRRCNYRLTGITGKSCPECGKDFSRRGPAMGKRRRHGWYAAALIASIVIVLAASDREKLRGRFETVLPGWHSAWLHDMKKQWPDECKSHRYVIDAHDARTGQPLASFDLPGGGSIDKVIPSAEGNALHIACGKEILRLDVNSGTVTSVPFHNTHGWVDLVAVTDDGRHYVVVIDGCHRRIDAQTGAIAPLFDSTNDDVERGLLGDVSAQWFAWRDIDGRLVVTEFATGKQVASLALPDELVHSVAMYPNLSDGILERGRVIHWTNWRFRTIKPLPRVYVLNFKPRLLETIVAPQADAIFNNAQREVGPVISPVPGGRYLLILHHLGTTSGFSHSAVAVWDRKTGSYVHQFDGPICEEQWAMHVSRDGRTLLVVSGFRFEKNLRARAWLYDISRFSEVMEDGE